MFKLHGCWLLYFGTALARNLGGCQIPDMYSNNILDLLGLTNSGTKCKDVVCKYEQVRTSIWNCNFILHFAFCILHFAFCILHFAFCILHVACCILHFASCTFQNLPVKHTFPNAFTKSNCKPDMSVNLKSACTYQPWFAFHVSI